MGRWLRACVVGTTLLLGTAAEPVNAWWRCVPACVPAPIAFVERTITCYRPEYRTEFREVQRTTYRNVPETREQEVRETVMVPHWREVPHQETIWVPQTREETRQRTIVRTE